jgi:hypothetical protein
MRRIQPSSVGFGTAPLENWMLFWPGWIVMGPYSKWRRVVPAGPVGGSVEVVTDALAVVGVVVAAVMGAPVVGAAAVVVGALVSVLPPLAQLAAINPIAAAAAVSHRPLLMP